MGKLRGLGVQNDATLVHLSRYFIKQLSDDEFRALYDIDIKIAASAKTLNIINQRRKELKLPRLTMAQNI